MENWKEVPGCEGLYEVSDHGRLRRLTRREGYMTEMLDIPEIITPKKTGRYLAATLCRDGWKKRFYLHHLVLLAFIGDRPAKETGSHLDGDGTNNQLSNLRWESHSANCRRKSAHGTMVRGEEHGQAKLTETQVRAIRASSLSHTALAKRLGVSRGLVSQVKRGEVWQHV